MINKIDKNDININNNMNKRQIKFDENKIINKLKNENIETNKDDKKDNQNIELK